MKPLYNKKWENVKAMNALERILREQRGYIFRMPPPGHPVILLLSGGLDSIISWAILLRKYRLRVYPVFLIRGRRGEEKRQESAIDHYAEIFQKKYSKTYIPPHKLTISMLEFMDPYKDLIGYLHSKVITDNLLPDGSLKPSFVLGHFSLFPYLGFLYAKFLHARENVDVKTIFCGSTYSDKSSYRTLTSARSVMLTLGLLSGEVDWQYTSVAYEPMVRSFFTKSDLIRWASAEKIPLNRAWTCIWNKPTQCGECLACLSRKYAFREAGVVDMTPYNPITQSFMESMVGKIFNKIKRLIDNRIFSDKKKEEQRNMSQEVSRKSKLYERPTKSKIFLSV